MLIEILIALEFFNHLFCTGLVKLVPAKHIHDNNNNQIMRLFEAIIRTEWKDLETKGKFPVNQMNCFAMPMKCYYSQNRSSVPPKILLTN